MPIVPAIYAASAVTGVMLAIYNSWRSHPDVEFAQHLRGLQIAEAQRKSQELDLEEKVHSDFARVRSRKLESLVGLKEGIDTGYTSPAELGIAGGGVAARDMPMIGLMAARMGMDPQDLAARFDPSQMNVFTPPSRRGAAPRPRPEQVAQAEAGPAQMNPMAGFGQ